MAKNLQILDCTLRDGGYCNQWCFGEGNIKKISCGLSDAGIEIIELGFLTNKVSYDPDISKYTTIEEAARMIPANRAGKLFVCMTNYGEYEADDIPEWDGSSVDGLRVAFHKKDLLPALELCKGIQQKGYKVFIQAMVSLSYSDDEFLDLIRRVNEFGPYAFYIVDSFGVMKNRDLARLFYLVDHNLENSIKVGFHSHNNMQLAYSNAQSLVDMHTSRDLIIDSSVYGMGRGAGNLNTELFVEYLNDNLEKNYALKPLLTIIDEILNHFYQQKYWGYSLPNYISAKNNAHPNYASFLDDKKTLTIEDMENIFQQMDEDKKVGFDKAYIAELYTKYLAAERVQDAHKGELAGLLKGKKILLVAPGKSSETEKSKIEEYAKGAVCISINYNYPLSDYIFISNLRRFRELDNDAYSKCIVTSNIPSNDVYLQTKYRDLLNDVESVKDNAGLMAMKYLMEFDIEEIGLAGFDGYSHETDDNYADKHMEIIVRNARLDSINAGMETMLKTFAEKIKIRFVTNPKYVNI